MWDCDFRYQLAASVPRLARQDSLSRKASSGRSTSTDAWELENYLNAGRTLELLKAMARLALRGAAWA
jgi:hypothetical protein